MWKSIPTSGFGELLAFDDEFIPPLAPLLTSTIAETVLYLCNGTLENVDPASDLRGALLSGAFQRVGSALESLFNTSTENWARVLRIRLRPVDTDPEPHDHRLWFSAAERRGRLCLVASSEADDGALWIPQSVLIYSSILQAGQHVVCELERSRRAWVHVVRGSAKVLGNVLEVSDSAEVRGVRGIGITAREPSELLILDMAAGERSDHRPSSAKGGAFNQGL